MDLSRRELLAASALLLARPGRARSTAPAAADAPQTAPPGRQPIVLCWNENPYGPSPAARAAVTDAISSACRYPDQDIDALVEALAAHEGVPTSHIVTGSGSGELLCALGFIHGHDGGEIIAAEPTYAELPNYARHAGASLKFVPVDKQLRHDLDALHAAVSARTRAVYVCNPNNPTGTALPATRLKSFIAALPERVTTIVDEAYMDFADAPGVASVTDLVRTDRRVVVLKTFSKLHGMAGIRVGYGIAHPDTASELAATRMSTANIFAMRAARASLGDHAFLTDCRRRIIASRRRITHELSRLGLGYAEPQGNFVFFDTGMPLPLFTQQMSARNILVARNFPPFDTWCRITIGTAAEVQAFLTALSEIVPSRSA
jgi:histidinol-phosphate aminotransferase